MKHLSAAEFTYYIGNSTKRQRKIKFQYSCYPHAAVLQLIEFSAGYATSNRNLHLSIFIVDF